MTAKKMIGIIMASLGGIGVLLVFLIVNSEVPNLYTYAPPLTDHEIMVILIGIVSALLVVAGIILITTEKADDLPAPKKDALPVEGKLEGDLVRKLKKGTDHHTDPHKPRVDPTGDSRKSETPQKTLDAAYASEHGFWICPIDETMVPNSENTCPVCGRSHR